MKDVRRDSFGVVVTHIVPLATGIFICRYFSGIYIATHFVLWDRWKVVHLDKELFTRINFSWQGDVRMNLKRRWSHTLLVLITTPKLTECWSSAVSFFSRCNWCAIAS